MNQLSCAEFAALAPELALDLLSGDERAAALVHLGGCRACRTNLDELARTADALLLVAPKAEPPAGFESRVLARLAAENGVQRAGKRWPFQRHRSGMLRPDHRGRRWIRPLSMVAALLIAVGTVGLIVGRHTAGRPQHSAIRTATVWADRGRSTCQVVAVPGRDGHGAELLLRLDEIAEQPSAYPVLVEPVTGGPAVPIGRVDVVGGRGTFDAVVPTQLGKIRGVQVREEGGQLRYQATFAAI